MKKYLTLITLSFVFVASAQFAKESLYNKGIVCFKDGTSKRGLVKRRSLGGIKFKESSGSIPESYDSTHIIGYDDLIKKEKYLYKTIYITTHKTARHKTTGDYTTLMKVEQLGKLNLYSVYKSSAPMYMGMPGSSTGMMMTMGGGANVYYIENKDKIINVGQKIRKNEWYLFEDCAVLIKKLKQKEIEKGSIVKIVDLYNNECE